MQIVKHIGPIKKKISNSMLIIFIGVLFILIYFGVSDKLSYEYKRSIFDLGLAVISIGLVSFILLILEGDPISILIQKIENYLTQKSIGVEKVDIRNQNYNFNRWRELVKTAKEIDLMGYVLKDNFFKNDDFVEALIARFNDTDIKKRPNVRVLVSKPYSENIGNKINKRHGFDDVMNDSRILFQRSIDEVLHKCYALDKNANIINSDLVLNKAREESLRMHIEIKETIDALKRIEMGIKSENKKFKFRVSVNSYLCCSIARFDDQILVINYLHQTGSNSPILEIKGKNTEYYKIYSHEFNKIWTFAVPCN